MQLHSHEEGSIMGSATERHAKPAQKSFPIRARAQAARDEKNWVGAGETVFPPPRRGTAGSETVLIGPSQVSARTRLAYGLLKASMNEAVQAIGSNHALFATGWWAIQAHTIESVQASAIATIELMEALNRAEGPKDVAAAQFAHRKRQRDAIDRQMIEFLAAAHNMISVLTEPPSDSLVDRSKAGKCPAAPCKPQSVAERLKTLTQRQRRVLELMADGLPNKLIAYELGLCETTVKAHVSEILRKLCVYNRARAIVLLANIDLTYIFSPGADSESGGL
jgi:DNA-binding NarL/FixJ family response regulator